MLQEHQRHGEAGDPDRDREPAGVEIVAVVMAVARDRDNDDDLRDLRRLELERADLEPRLRALHALADVQHRHEHRERSDVDR